MRFVFKVLVQDLQLGVVISPPFLVDIHLGWLTVGFGLTDVTRDEESRLRRALSQIRMEETK